MASVSSGCRKVETGNAPSVRARWRSGHRAGVPRQREKRGTRVLAGPAEGAHDELRPCLDFQLGEDAGDVVAHRLLAQGEPRGDLCVVEALGDEIDDFLLASGKTAERLARWRTAQEGTHLLEPAAVARLGLEQDVVAALERHEACAGNEAREKAALLERHACIVARVQHERRTRDPGRELRYVDAGEHGEETGGDRRLRGNALELVEPRMLLGRAVGNELRGEELAERRILAAPAELDQLAHGFGKLPLARRIV